ncbi:MAG: alpha-ketoacid dehydrogenase subunit beta [Chloroflexi bacterium]|nr:alpha-ketoacid dehydrogenase subunit beta [Chloroflexota bacterium]
MAELIIREAIRKGLQEALETDDRVFLMGEDIGVYQGSYAVTRGFFEEFGSERIRDCPIAESVIIGAATGAAMAGMRPIVEMMTINFMLLGIDQVVNHAAKMSYMSNGQIKVPLVIRAVTGGGGRLAATHSQNFEGWYASVPGLKVCVPSDPYDALGLLRTAIADPNPVIFAEHGLLYGKRGEVPDGHYTVPMGQAAVRREGTDITLAAYGRMVYTSLEAADRLAERGVEAEVIDLRTLQPLDTDTIVQSVEKTNRVVIVEENWRTGGFSAEIASTVHEAAFDYLDGPVGRVSGHDVPAPYNANLEDLQIPDADRIIAEIEKLYSL